MTTVLLFVEHELSGPEAAATIGALADLSTDGEGPVRVTVLVPYGTAWAPTLMDDIAASRGSTAPRALGDARAEAALVRRAANQVLRHTLTTVRIHGHAADGELVPVRDAVRDLATEAAARDATTALVVSSPHRLAHLVRQDLEHRLRRAGVRRVVHVGAARSGAAVPASAFRARPST
jgi:hypothetical protein